MSVIISQFPDSLHPSHFLLPLLHAYISHIIIYFHLLHLDLLEHLLQLFVAFMVLSISLFLLLLVLLFVSFSFFYQVWIIRVKELRIVKIKFLQREQAVFDGNLGMLVELIVGVSVVPLQLSFWA